YPRIDLSGDNMYVAWVKYNQTANNGKIVIIKSSDNGNTFGEAIDLGNDKGDSLNPNIKASLNKAYIIWTSGEGNSKSNILLSPYSSKHNEESSTLQKNNHPPVASNQTVTINGTNLFSHIQLSGHDDDNDTLTMTIVSPPSHGILSHIIQRLGLVF